MLTCCHWTMLNSQNMPIYWSSKSIPGFIESYYSNTMRFDQRWKILFFTFFIIKLWLLPYFKFSVYLFWLLFIKLKYSEYSFSYTCTILQYEVYQDPGKVITDSIKTNSYNFHIHKILSILNVLSIYVNNRKVVVKNVHRGCTSEQIS